MLSAVIMALCVNITVLLTNQQFQSEDRVQTT
jgi:hypothetical protein